jgi:hypothetical protein
VHLPVRGNPNADRGTSLLVRAQGDPVKIAAQVREEMRMLDADLPEGSPMSGALKGTRKSGDPSRPLLVTLEPTAADRLRMVLAWGPHEWAADFAAAP